MKKINTLSVIQNSGAKGRIYLAQILLLILSLLPYYSTAQQVVRITSSPIISSTLVVEKTVQSANGNYYVLCHGTDASPYNHDSNVTMVYECTSFGGVIWCYEYGMGPTPGYNSTLRGRAIAIGNGASDTEVAIGGYVDFGPSNYNFVMELDTGGSVLWFQRWSYPSCEGVYDLIFNHEGGLNTGSITAVTIDHNFSNGYDNLHVTLINSSGIISSELLTDNAENAVGSPIGVTNKPRIVESPSNSAYYVVASRVGGPNNIAFWTIGYGLSGTPNLNVYSETGPVNATGMIEDEGSYSPGGVPTVFICGYEAAHIPLFIEVTSLTSATPTFTPLDIPIPSYISSPSYLYPTDLAIVGTASALMATINFQGIWYGHFLSDNMQLYQIPMSFSLSPTISANNFAPPDNGSYGGICSSGSTYTSPYISAGYDSTTGDVVFVQATGGPLVCQDADASGTYSSVPTYSVSFSTAGTSDPITAYSSTPHVHIVTQYTTLSCVWVGTDPEPFSGKAIQTIQKSASENIASGLNISRGNGQFTVSSYPNPVTGLAYIDITGQISTGATVTVYDLVGRALFNTNAAIEPGTSHIAIDIGSLSAGAYIIQVANPDKSINASIRIEKQ